MTDLVLTPAACYPVYPAIAARGPLAAGGITVDAGGSYVFRHEPSGDPARLQMFHQREIVRIGEPETVAVWRDAWRDRSVELLRAVGLDARFDVASDPFFGRSGRLLARSQRAQALKFEVLVQIAGPEPTAVASFNYHQDHFSSTYGIAMEDGDVPAHTACLGFGLERITLALLRTHGLDVDAWPAEVRERTEDRMSAASDGFVSLLGLDPAGYRPHLLHGPERTYIETNCYTDILIEFLHARGDEPLAMMGCVLRVDFEGDQWTFFKPLPEHLERLYGVDIHEMQPYRPLPEQIAEQIALDRTIVVELDSWYLPDTAATSYRREHVKSSVVAEAIDPDGERLRYFHGPGYHELEGEDYRGIFRLGRPFSEDVLPPYTELVRFDAGGSLTGDVLRAAARELLIENLARRPQPNPFERFGAQLTADLPTPARGRRQRLPRLCVRDRPHGRLSVRGRRLTRRMATRRNGSPRHGGDAADRRRMQDPLVQARAASPVRSRAGDRRAGSRVG